jgi:hypothetical protein
MCLPLWGGGYFIFVIPAGSSCLKIIIRIIIKSESKNHPFWVFEKLQRTIQFHERTGKDPTILGGYFISL